VERSPARIGHTVRSVESWRHCEPRRDSRWCGSRMDSRRHSGAAFLLWNMRNEAVRYGLQWRHLRTDAELHTDTALTFGARLLRRCRRRQYNSRSGQPEDAFTLPSVKRSFSPTAICWPGYHYLNIPGQDVQTIIPGSSLPAINRGDYHRRLYASGASVNTLAQGSNAVLRSS
jgi:hypothetical protein